MRCSLCIGWKVVLSPRVPSFTSACVAPAFQALLASVPSLHRDGSQPRSTDFDWALHPGGSTILSGVQQAMGLSEEQLMASYHTYVEHGNSSSATIMSVMDRMRRSESKKEDVIACAFGPGINLEMMALKRRKWAIDAPSLTNGHSVVQEAVETNGHGASNRVVEQQVNGSTGGPSLNHETQGLSHAAETNGSRVVVSASAGGSDRLRNDTFSRNETNETTKTPMTLDGVNGLPAEDLD